MYNARRYGWRQTASASIVPVVIGKAMPLREIIEFVLLGLGVSLYGTLVGAGGGFIIVPILLIAFSSEFSTRQASGTSLFVVLCNGLSASVAYWRQKKIDYATGLRFAAATVPSAFIGGQVAQYFGSAAFKLLFGALLIGVAILVNVLPDRSKVQLHPRADPLPRGFVRRTVTDAQGRTTVYTFNLWSGVLFSLGIGFLASLLGIGGGIFMVPFMVFVLGIPAHVATATSSFVLIFTSASGLIPHLRQGNVVFGPAVAMAAGVLVGAQIGAFVAQLVKGQAIIRFLSLALIATGLQLIVKALSA